MAVDISKLTMGEVAVIEDLSGEKYIPMMESGAPSAKALAAIAMVVKRREQLANGETPNFSWNQAQDLNFDDVMALISPDSEDEAADPKVIESKPTKTSSKATKA